MSGPIEIFISHGQGDEDSLKELEKQLIPMQRKGSIILWDTRQIVGGSVATNEIDRHLNSAQIFLLLITPNYISSDNYSLVVDHAMARQRKGEASVIPILLSRVFWEDEPYGRLKPLPDNKQPVSSWHNKSEAFFNIAEGIRTTVENLTASPTKITVSLPSGPNNNRLDEVSPLTAQPNTLQTDEFDVFISHSHLDATWVEILAMRLEDEQSFRVWLDQWFLIPGQSFQKAMAEGITQAKCCIICISEHTPSGWFKREIERALNTQTKSPSFRVIPVLLPNALNVNVDDFLELNTWVDFRNSETDYAFHRLVCGVKGIPPGRWPPQKTDVH